MSIQETNLRICAFLGIETKNVQRATIDLVPGEPPRVMLTRWVVPLDGSFEEQEFEVVRKSPPPDAEPERFDLDRACTEALERLDRAAWADWHAALKQLRITRPLMVAEAVEDDLTDRRIEAASARVGNQTLTLEVRADTSQATRAIEDLREVWNRLQPEMREAMRKRSSEFFSGGSR